MSEFVSAWLVFSRTRLYQSHITFSFHSLLWFSESSINPRHLLIFISTRFSVFASLIQLRPLSTSHLWTVRRKASAHSGVKSSDSSTGSFILPRWKIFSVYIIFRTSTQSSWSQFLPVCHPRNSCDIFAFLFAIGNRWTSCYATHATYAT